MNALEFITATGAGLVGVICGILIFHRGYKDRLPRRVGLVIISVSAFAQIAMIVSPIDYSTKAMAELMGMIWCGMALFFFSHVCSFIQRFRKQDNTWYQDTVMVMKGRKR